MTRFFVVLILIFVSKICLAQKDDHAAYFEKTKEISRSISQEIYSDFAAFNSLPQASFIRSVDSMRSLFTNHLHQYTNQLDPAVVADEKVSIRYFFDRLLLEYPSHHEIYTGNRASITPAKQAQLDKNLVDFNKPALLANEDYRDYIEAYLGIQTERKKRTAGYANQDNQSLQAVWFLIDSLFTNQKVKDTWRYQYLYQHMDNNGIKNIENIYDNFLARSQNPDDKRAITVLYDSIQEQRASHLIETYKTVDGFDLDMHLFLPDSTKYPGKRPTIVYFHGGSWSEGKPDWFFGEGEYHASQGWVAAAVEYRTKARHNTLPFEAVRDAKSAIRWLRENSQQYHIDTAKIIATGNSAGGHLALMTALTDDWNETTDDLTISAIPNVLMVNSGVFDLTVENARWITRDLKNKEIVREISPNHLVKEGFPPTLIIHGKQDGACPFSSAEYFVEKMNALGNNVAFHPLEDAGHFIWFGEYGNQVSEIRGQYIESLNFD